jgi:hypothetical protein
VILAKTDQRVYLDLQDPQAQLEIEAHMGLLDKEDFRECLVRLESLEFSARTAKQDYPASLA